MLPSISEYLDSVVTRVYSIGQYGTVKLFLLFPGALPSTNGHLTATCQGQFTGWCIICNGASGTNGRGFAYSNWRYQLRTRTNKGTILDHSLIFVDTKGNLNNNCRLA